MLGWVVGLGDGRFGRLGVGWLSWVLGGLGGWVLGG